MIRSKSVTKRLFEEIAPRFSERNGGYVRVIKQGFRPGDQAAMSIVELVEKSPQSSDAKGKGRGSKRPERSDR